MTSAWEDRFRAARVTLPDWADDAPARCLVRSNATGTWELYALDLEARAGDGGLRQVTSREHGTLDGTVSRDGQSVWWFDDTSGDELGVWRRQPFAGGPDEEALPGLPAAYDAGLAFAPDGGVAVGSTGAEEDGGCSVVRVVAPAGTGAGGDPGVAREVYRHAEDAWLAALSHDGALLAVGHSERGDNRHPALRVLRSADGSTVGELDDGAGRGVQAAGFAPVTGDPRLLVVHERRGRAELLLWDPRSGAQEELALDLPGDLGGDWLPDASALLVTSDAGARTTLHRLDLATRGLVALQPPDAVPGTGSISGATARPDGAVWVARSSAAEPPAVVDSATGLVVVRPPGELVAPPSVPVRDVTATGPGGPVHALLAVPEGGQAPYATVFVVHGGPESHDEDDFRPDVAAWVDAGYAVVCANYRGSDGYGSAWRDAASWGASGVGDAPVGLTELADLAAVRARLVDDGVADPARVVLSGASWGGYLTLLGLGVQPDLWAVGLAGVPVADYVTAYAQEMEALQGFDRALFGGTPEQVMGRYEQSSPLTYVGAVRAPLWLSVGENDPRCPSGQVDRFLAALAGVGRVEPEVLRFDAGHGSLVVEERIRQLRAELTFALRHAPPSPPPVAQAP